MEEGKETAQNNVITRRWIGKNLLIFLVFLALNLLLLLLEKTMDEEYLNILGAVWVVGLFATIIFYNHKILQGVERPSRSYTLRLLGILGMFILQYSFISFFNWYLLYPLVRS